MQIHSFTLRPAPRLSRTSLQLLIAACLITMPGLTSCDAQTSLAPHLEQRGVNTQLVVDGKPFFMIAGELRNSSSSSLDYMKPVWPRLAAMNLNTVLTPISWELVEPIEGHFDFALIDGLLAQAREQHLHIVFLWLAAWKNGMSGYPPVWVKQDTRRFPRAILYNAEANVLSTFAPATRDADARALAAVVQHIREADSRDHTVLMLQVENEVGILGSTRDHSPAADKAFAAAVPPELTKYLAAHTATLDPEFKALWEANGSKTAGTWAQIFGETERADEIFMAWNYAVYVHAVAAKAKAAYDLPLYVNTWLANATDKPGNYPSGGPQPRVLDIWKAARSLQKGPSLDFYAPDLYAADFPGWAARYHRDGNAFFLPETNSGDSGAANIFYAAGEHAALGFSPFGIDSTFVRERTGPDRMGPDPLAASYAAIAEIAPALLAAQGSGLDAHGNPKTHGFLVNKEHPKFDFNMGDFVAHVSLDEIFGHQAEKGSGLIIQTGPDEFLGVGRGFRVSFTLADNIGHAGLASIDEGHYVEGKWVAGRRLNGDEDDQGSNWRFDQFAPHIERAKLYRYE